MSVLRAAALAAVIVTGASGLGCGAYHTTSKPNDADLVGHWHIRPSSAAYVKEWYAPLDAATASIDLAVDGTVTFTGVPSILLDETDLTTRRLVDRHGHWKVKQFEGQWHVQVSCTTDSGRGFELGVTLWNAGPPHWLSLNCEDPDVQRFVFFDRDADAKTK